MNSPSRHSPGRGSEHRLVNAAKHAAGQHVAVRLDYGDADVKLTVRNGMAPAPTLKAQRA